MLTTDTYLADGRETSAYARCHGHVRHVHCPLSPGRDPCSLNFRALGLLLWVGERDPARSGVARFAADVLPFWSPGPGGTGRRTLVVGLLLLLLGFSWSCFLVGWGLFGPFVLCACVCCLLSAFGGGVPVLTRFASIRFPSHSRGAWAHRLGPSRSPM
jgi:hypothetical protein